MNGFQNQWGNFEMGSIRSGAAVALGSLALTASFSLISQAPASAQAAYGSYIGAGASFGLTEGGDDDDREISGVVALRYKFLRAPISVRTQALIGSNVAVVPTISYDFPLSWNADAYIGAGASIPIGGNTPVGDQTSFAIQPGIDYTLPNSNLVVFGNAIISFDAYENGGGTAASIQGGVGLRF